MRYFHRTSVSLPDVLAAADAYFAGRLSPGARDAKRRTFSGSMGTVSVSVKADGGHYTLITVETDQVGESEIDKLSKRFLSTVHAKVHPEHQVRGAY